MLTTNHRPAKLVVIVTAQTLTGILTQETVQHRANAAVTAMLVTHHAKTLDNRGALKVIHRQRVTNHKPAEVGMAAEHFRSFKSRTIEVGLKYSTSARMNIGHYVYM